MDTQILLELQASYIRELEKRIEELEDRLERYEQTKNSRNSSTPPSKDQNRPFKSKSLREQTGKKPGGQTGHEGNTLKMVSNPDFIINHIPDYCSCCGQSLKEVPSELQEKRQIIDLPEIKPKITEHRIYQKQCSCGHITKCTPTEGLKNRIIYGNNIAGLNAYLSVRQYIPFKRLQEIFFDIFSIGISEGGLHELLKRVTKKAYPVYEQIKGKIVRSEIVGSDETGTKINGANKWIWTWQNPELTFITVSNNRGTDTINNNFEKGFAHSILVHDCWKSHFKTEALSHQVCIAHLLRELNGLSEQYKNSWSEEFRQLLLKALEYKKQLNPEDYLQPQKRTLFFESWLDSIIEKGIDPNQKDLIAFQKRMRKYKSFILTFLHHPKVPPDNNGSERAIRNIKVKQKISGQFKSYDGATTFAILRSVTDTAIKNDQNVLDALTYIAKYQGTD